MVYCVTYKCAKKHRSNTNAYIRRVSAIKTHPEPTTTENYQKKNSIKYRPYMEEPQAHASTGLLRTDKYHFILNEVMR